MTPPLECSLQWILERLPNFDPLVGQKPQRLQMKAFAELAMVHMYAHETVAGTPSPVALLKDFAQASGAFVRSCCERPAFAEVARREPLLGYLCLLPYLTLRSTGFRVEAMEQAVVWLQRFRLPGSVESLPYRRLDREYFLWKGGLAKGPPRWDSLLAATVLGARRGTLYYDRDEAYSVTHTLMYVTDFGKRPDACTGPLRLRTELLLESLILHYWRLRNWDLLGELLMGARLIGMPTSGLLCAASTALAEQVDEDGSLPASTRERRQEERRKRRAVAKAEPGMDAYTAKRYHPTFVWVLYALARLRAGDAGV